jgi:hypothetical protein
MRHVSGKWVRMWDPDTNKWHEVWMTGLGPVYSPGRAETRSESAPQLVDRQGRPIRATQRGIGFGKR